MLSSYTHIGKNHIHLDSIDSTNDYAYELLSKSNPIDGTVISASFQTNGHGQFDRKWESNKDDNILMSIILYPNFLKMEYQFLLSISISLGIRDYIADNGLDSQIKWPNDIYVGSKKIAGILIKNAIIGSELKSSIVGIGLNVNQTKFRNNDIATSLSQELNKTFNLKEELNKLSNRMEIKYNQLREKPELEFIKMYEASMYYKDKTINFSKDNVKSHLTIRGINLEGKLVASDNFNKQVLISHGEGIITY